MQLTIIKKFIMKKSVLKTFKKFFFYSSILASTVNCGLDNFSNNSEITTLTKIHSDQKKAIFFMKNKNDDLSNRKRHVCYTKSYWSFS